MVARQQSWNLQRYVVRMERTAELFEYKLFIVQM